MFLNPYNMLKKTLITIIFYSSIVLSLSAQDITRSELAIHICSCYNASLSVDDQMKILEEGVLKWLGLDKNHPNSKKIFGNFLNENHSLILCGDDGSGSNRKIEPLIKRSIGRGEYGLIDSLMYYEEEYGYNLNHFEIVNGKKETILDYIEMILNNPELLARYNADKLRVLHNDFIEYDAKRGSEL